MAVNYRLVALTHGVDDYLTGALNSFVEHVTPMPAEVVIHTDGREAGDRAYELIEGFGPRIEGVRWTLSQNDRQQGFCGASREAWTEAAALGVDYVFWLEHDFEFLRRIDLEEVARRLDANHALAQMTFCRNAVNEEEKAAGGIVASRPGAFTDTGDGWLQHTAYWSTNPSLFRREVAVENEWPDVSQCEGHLSIRLREGGYVFGMWGDGAEWVRHVGMRRGFGY